jgi:hypothetical protein
MLRLIAGTAIGVLFGAFLGGVTQFLTGYVPLSLILGSLGTAVVLLYNVTKGRLEIAKGTVDLKLKKRELEDLDSRVVKPSSDEVRQFGKPMKTYTMEIEKLDGKSFIVKSSEEKTE